MTKLIGEHAPWPTLVDPEGRRWDAVEGAIGEEALDGVTGTLLFTQRPGVYHDATRLMQMAKVRYPLPTSEAEAQELGLNGFALEFAKRVLRTAALRKKGLPILTLADPACRAYLERLVPVIEQALHVDNMKARRLASLLTDTPASDASVCGLKALAKAWAEGDGTDASANKQALRGIKAGLDELEDPPELTANDWFRKAKLDADMRTFKLLDVRFQKAIPGYKPGLDWVIPEIIREPMKATRIAHARAVRPSDTGAIPRYMHRLVIDGMVFGHKRKMTGASVLIDCSGSMGVTQEQVLLIAQYFPAGIVAGYSGEALRILAEKGRVVADAPLDWNGTNECDGPALEWLLRQGGPRFWISDGGVTLRGDYECQAASDHCAVLCRWGNIERIASMRLAIDRLKRVAAAKHAGENAA